MCERKPFSAMVLLPAQKLSSVVWGFIGNNTLINIDAKNVEAKCSVPTKWEFYVGYFHSNFHHLNWFAFTLGDLAKRITRETSVFRNVIFLLNLELR